MHSISIEAYYCSNYAAIILFSTAPLACCLPEAAGVATSIFVQLLSRCTEIQSRFFWARITYRSGGDMNLLMKWGYIEGGIRLYMWVYR